LKLLFDQNISPRIVNQIQKEFAESKHVRHVGLEDSADSEIFQYAKSKGFSIVTFDSDFVDLNVVKGFPPKIIWLKTGNLTTSAISQLLNENILSIHNFLELQDTGILEIINKR
jgi:predicted nuclease of predicted toxin-antitoxin system